MPDTKEGRERQARQAERRRMRQEIEEARERLDEEEPDTEESDATGADLLAGDETTVESDDETDAAGKHEDAEHPASTDESAEADEATTD